MKNSFRVLPLALLAAASLHLKAAEPQTKFSANLGFLVATGDTKTFITGSTNGGYELGLGYTTHLDTADVDIRLHGNVVSINGQAGTGLESKNLNFLGGLDVVKPVGKYSFFGGLMAGEWNPNDFRTGTRFAGASNRPTGAKLAYRVGVEYAFLPNLSGRLAFTQSEYNLYLNPSFITTGIVFKF